MAVVRDFFRFGDFKIHLYKRVDLDVSRWHMCVFIQSKQYRRSLKTLDLDEARKAAQKVMLGLLVKAESGQKVFSVSLGELRREYYKALDDRVARGVLRSISLKNIYHHLKLTMEFLASIGKGAQTAFDSLDSGVWNGYVGWRVKARPNTSMMAINAELLTFRAMVLWAKAQGWCGERSVPVWDELKDKSPVVRRRISPVEFERTLKLIRGWAFDSGSYKQMLVFTVFHVMAFTGMRTGELLKIRNRNVRKVKDGYSLTVDAINSKVNKSRTVALIGVDTTALRGWLKDWQQNKGPDDFVFGGSERKAHDDYYYTYKVVRETVLAKAGLDWVDSYHARHRYITDALTSGQPVSLVAQHCGTSIKQIEQTYSNVLTENIGRKFAEQRVIYKPDGTWTVVKKRR